MSALHVGYQGIVRKGYEMDKELKFAVLIDADNISDRYVKIILDEVSNSGIATYKRIYGDWTSPRLASWKTMLLENSILPMQQYSYTTGKNSTDSAMIIDAMDILYSGTVDGFCIVSSDSDFTRLVARLRESGMHVIGMGEEKTPQPFISACNQFKYLDLLYKAQLEEEKKEKTAEEKRKREQCEKSTRRTQKNLKNVQRTINQIIDQLSDEEGWINSGLLGDQLSRRMPEFDVRNYGYKKFTIFLKSMDIYEVKKKAAGIIVRLKK